MSDTLGKFEQYSPNTDGFSCVDNFTEAIASPVGSLLGGATGLLGYHIPASQTAAVYGRLGALTFRTGQAEFLQQQFGTAAGVAGPSAVANTSGPLARPSPYVPPFLGASSLTPRAGFTPKGIEVVSLSLSYLVSTNNLTTLNIKLIARQFVNGAAAPSDTVLIAQTNLPKNSSANIQVSNIAVATPAFTVTPNTILQVLVNAVTPASSTLDIYEATVFYNFNYN